MSIDEFAEMVLRAVYVKVGLRAESGDLVYLTVSKLDVLGKADEIVGMGLSVEFGKGVTSDTLYIESV